MSNSVREVLEAFQIEPKRSLGQNFLLDPNAQERIANAANLTAEDMVIEVGPGTGLLTTRLAERARQVIAIELDDRLIPILTQNVPSNVRVLHADILETDIMGLVGDAPYKVVANLPYYITSAILRHFLELPNKPRTLVLTVQQEVADRLVSKPGDMTVLSVSVQFYGKPKVMGKIGAAAFWPRPDVTSAVVKIDPYPKPIVDVPSDATFFRVVRAGFSQKRKQLKNAVGDGLGFSHAHAADLITQAGINPSRRAETLTLDEWAALTRAVETHRVQS
jgi:16S rRNA (adenine1518-N6/adenine1519-N6)-dimethyltransferase